MVLIFAAVALIFLDEEDKYVRYQGGLNERRDEHFK